MKIISRIFLGVCLGVYLLLPAQVMAKDYQIDAVKLSIVLDETGSAQVSEERRYQFNGDYRYAYQQINKIIPDPNQAGRSDNYSLSNYQVCAGAATDFEHCYRQLDQAEINFEQARSNPADTFYVVSGDKYDYLQWHYVALDEAKLFTIHYTIDNAVTAHQDVAEFYWQFVGQDWEVSQHNLQVELSLPRDLLGVQLASVQAWGHGPLLGRLSISDLPNQAGYYLVTFTLADLEPGQFLEGRVLMPLGLFPNLEALASGQLTREQIEAEEEAYIAQTEAELAQEERQAKWLRFGALALSILGIYVIVYRFIQHHRLTKEDRLKKLSGVWEPPSDLEPAQVNQLLKKNKSLSQQVFTATVLALVHKKVCRITRSEHKEGLVHKDYRYYLVKTGKLESSRSKIKLSQVEQAVYDFIFDRVAKIYTRYFDQTSRRWLTERQFIQAYKTAHPDSSGEAVRQAKTKAKQNVALADIGQYTKVYATSSYNFFKSLEDKAWQANLAAGHFDQAALDYSHSWQNAIMFLVPVVSFVQAMISLNLAETAQANSAQSLLPTVFSWAMLNFIVGLFMAILLLAFQAKAHKRSQKGHHQAELWTAFKQHMKDYRQTKNYPIDSVILWEQYLVYGTLFGVSMKALAKLPVKFADWSDQDRRILASYWGMSGINTDQAVLDLKNFNLGSLSNSLNSLGSAFKNVNQQVSRSYGAHGGGSSGGFSGGGAGGSW